MDSDAGGDFGRRAQLLLLFLLVELCWATSTNSQQSTATQKGPDPVGKKAFISHCSGCHGLDGHGGDRAPAIAAGSDAARRTNAELKRIINHGVQGTGMPAFASLGSAQITSLIAYLRNLQGVGATVALPGDPQQGATLFFGKAGCSKCHSARGKGGFLASDVTSYGSGRTPAEIHNALVAPEKDSDHQLRQAVITTRNGQKYSGVVRTEDNFSLVLQTVSGEFVSIEKSEAASISYDSGTLMPRDYGSTLTARELNDLVSYLMSLPPHVDPHAAAAGKRRHWEDE